MPVSLDQILRSTRVAWDQSPARRWTLEREVAQRQVPPSFRAAPRCERAASRSLPRSSAGRRPLERFGRTWTRRSEPPCMPSTARPLTGGPDRRTLLRRLHRGPLGCDRRPVLFGSRAAKRFHPGRGQILEARAAGAAAVLLIVRAFGPGLSLLRCAADLGLDALVEVHTPEELERGLGGGKHDHRCEQPRSRYLRNRYGRPRGRSSPGFPPNALPWRRAAWPEPMMSSGPRRPARTRS